MSRRRAVAAFWAAGLFLASCSSSNDEKCGDREDNDQNGQTDCEDSACGAGAGCGPNGFVCAPDKTCSACSGNGGVAEANGETTCSDDLDNDCDGAIDCADESCRDRICDSEGNSCSPPVAGGQSTCGGVPGGGGAAGTIGYFRLAGVEHPVLGAVGSGYREQSLLTFEVLGVDGEPLAGLRVTFTHASQGGSFIGAVASCPGTSPPSCTAQGTTDEAVRVGVLLHAGRRFAVLTIHAEATAAGVTRELVAGGFTVVGAKPTGARFSVDCRPYNVPALTVTDCLYSRYAGQARNVDCTATLGDRHGNLVAVPTLVSFQTEAGEIVPAAVTPGFDPASSTAGMGQAIGVLDVYGAPLPWDVLPFPAEAFVDLDYGCGPRRSNPRDGLVSIVAMVEGEEGFVDESLDGEYDPGEPFVDLGEPFLDVDDDGVRDSGVEPFDDLNHDGVYDLDDPFLDVDGDGVRDDALEWFDDLNEDGLYTGPNGVWDGKTVLWTQARVAYTGYPYFDRDGAGQDLFTRIWEVGSPPSPTVAAAPFLVSAGPPPTTQFYSVFFTDRHLNPLGSFSSFHAEPLAGNVSAKLSPPTHTADRLPTSFRMLYCDSLEPTATCLDGPADQACVTSPCYLTTEVGDWFLYGNDAYLSITGANPGPDAVQVWATVENVSNVLSISGECVP